MDSLKLHRVGDAVVVTIPDDVISHFGLKEGDSLSLERGVDGITLKPEPTEADRDGAARMARRYAGVLKRLAR